MSDSTQHASFENELTSKSKAPSLLARLSGIRLLNDLSIGGKLNIGFGVLVGLTLLVAGLGTVAGNEATRKIEIAEGQRVPTVLVLSRAQTSLLAMQSSVRGYLVLSNLQNRDDYNRAKLVFETSLAELEEHAAFNTDQENIRRIEELKNTFEAWVALPERLFELHDDPDENQPAVRIARLQIQPLHTAVLDEIEALIESEEQRGTPRPELLEDLTDFQTTFDIMATNLKAYAASGNLNNKFIYANQLNSNNSIWEELQSKRSLLDEEQQATLDNIINVREQLLALSFEIFHAVEGERAYEDLYLFRTEVIPRTEYMLDLLDELTTGQQRLLQTDLSEAKDELARSQSQTMIGGLLALGLAVVMAVVFQGNIAGPVRRLTDTVEQIIAGDLSAQARVESRDEIGRLATNFNTMTGQLRENITSLDRRGRQLEIVVEISQNLLRILELSDLLRQTVILVKETFDFYHVHIYLFDEDREKLVMAEGYGQAGEEMKRKGHSIPLNAPKSFVARAARYGTPVRVDEVRTDEGWLPNPLLPETHSEVAVPVILEDKVVGVLDVQSEQVAGFDTQDIAIISTVANQIALALQNIQRFEETARALADAERLQQQYLQTGWQSFLTAHNSVTYQHTKPNAGAVDESLLSQIKQNIRKGQKIIIAGSDPRHESDGKAQSALAMPLALRGNIIGNIRIHDTEKGRQWSSEEVALLEAVSEQMSLALENARLFDETRQRATREQLARQITDKMRSAPNVDSIVETGLTELAKALGVSRTYVKFTSRIESGDELQPPVSEIEAIRSKLKPNGGEARVSSPLPDKGIDNSDQVEEI